MLEEFGVRFMDTLIIKRKNDHLQNLPADIVFKNKQPIPADTWIKAKGTFIAKGGEHIMILGNFNTDDKTSVIPIVKQKKKSYDNKQSRTYYIFDDFRLCPVDTEVSCNLKEKAIAIYADNIRHAIPVKKQIEETVLEETITSEPEKIVESEFLVIEEDSILISETFELPDILFESNSDRLLAVSYPSLRKLANYLLMNRQYTIQITGHTDNVGADNANLNLSERRAKAVHNYLLQQGVFKDKITYFGKGESEPIDTNDTELGRSRNRRVEFSLESRN